MRKFYARILLVLFAFVTSFYAHAQITNYSFTATTGTFTPISGGTAVATSTSAADFLGDTKTSVALPIGFTFNFNGTDYTQVVATSDGFLSFNTSATSTAANNLATSTAARRPLVAPLWDDLDGASGSGAANYITTGSPGSRVFTIEWLNWQWNWNASGATISFQVKLYEGTNVIEFNYRQESGTVNSGSASIGIAASGTGSGNYLSLNNSSASPTVSSTTETTNISTKPATDQIYRFSPPVACSGAPVAGTTVATPGAVCYGGNVVLSLTGATTGVSGLTYQWQYAQIASPTWNDITGATSASFSFNATQSLQYRAKVTCTTTGISDFSTPLVVSVSNTPTYGTIPFSESFETWSDACGTTDRPGVNWGSFPSTGDNSWRRNDQGASASWTSTSGAYSPVFTIDAHSARFHTYDVASGGSGGLDLFLDLSTVTGNKFLSFDYINTSGTDKLQVFVSTDGGVTFTQSGANLGTQSPWGNKQFVIASNSATTVIRLLATSDFGFTDIGIDNLAVVAGCSGTPTAGTASATLSSICYGGSTVLSLTGATTGVGGLSYQWQSSPDGTTWTNIAGATNATYNLNGVVATLQYRAVITCSNGGASDNSSAVTVTVSLPTPASLPYVQDFETWVDGCSTTDRPDAHWGTFPSTSDSSWRRDDQGASASWTLAGSGSYSPVFTTGAHSARFHTYEASSTTKGTMDLFIDLSSDPSAKLLKFDYINTTGTDTLRVLLSTDGGQSFYQLGSTLGVQATWATKQFIINSAANAIIRLQATSDFGLTDIGVDNLQVLVGCTNTPTPGSVSTTDGMPLCVGSSLTLNLTGQTAAAGIAYQWQSSPDNSTWTNIGGATGTSYVATPSANTYYRVVVTCTNTSQSDQTAGFQVTVNSPSLTSTTPGTRCGIGTVTLGAVGSAGTTIKWYAAATGGSPIATGGSFITPSISANTTYYVAAESGIPPLGQGASTSTSYESPYYHLYGGKKSQYLILASELTSLGLTAGNINSIGFSVVTAGTTYNNFNISMKNTSATSMTTTLETALTTVYTAASVTPTVGVNMYSFGIPFAWDGTSNVILEVCWSNNNTGGTSAKVKMDATSFVSNAYYRADNQSQATICGATTATSTQSLRPQIIFDATYCPGTRTAITATVTTPPSITVLPASATICSGQSATLVVSSGNAGYTFSWTPGGQSGSPISVSPTTTTKYFVTATDNSGGSNDGCVNQDSITVTVNPLPSAPVITPSSPSICSGTIQQLSGNASLTNQFVSGTQANQNAATGYPSPYSNYYGGNRHQFLVLASELSAAGFSGGSQISDIQFPVVSLGSSFTNNQNFQISIGNTSLTSLTTFQSGLTQVVAPSTFTPTVGYTNTHTFSTPFVWDGTSNIIIETTYSNNNFGATSDAVITYNSPTPFQSTIVYRVDNTSAATVASATTVSLSYNARPDFKLNGSTISSITWAPLTGLYTDAAATTPYTGSAASTVYAKPVSTTTYTATAANVYSCTSSTNVTVSITPSTLISTQPQSQIACTGSNVTLSVAATGAGLSYQWRKNGTNVGTNSPTLALTNVQPSDAGNYDVVVTGTCGIVTSSIAVVQIGDNSWTGTSNTDWNNALNWCGGVPTATTNVLIPSGTPFSPVITANSLANNLTVNSGATVTISASGRLKLAGNFVNNGTLTATNGTFEFTGAANQSVAAITAANIIMNGAGGITLTGAMNIGTALTLTNGNITLGSNNLTMTGGSAGSVASHIVTNGTGKVTNNNINAASVIFPVGPTATSYNPVLIANGQGKNYTVGVATGLPATPGLANSARAVNRTWNITVNTAPTSAVSVALQYADADVNASGTGSANMEAGVSNGSNWLITTPSGGVAPIGTTTARVVGFQTITFGNTVMANIGGVNFPTAVPNIDADVTSIILMPNPVVNNNSILRVNSRRTTKVEWSVIDANGRTVMTFSKQIFAGQNDIQLKLAGLAGGTYQLIGRTDKGKTTTVRFVRM